MHKAKNIYFLLIKKKKKRDGPRQGVAQSRVPSPICSFERSYERNLQKINHN